MVSHGGAGILTLLHTCCPHLNRALRITGWIAQLLDHRLTWPACGWSLA